MTDIEYKETIFKILNNFKGIEPLKELFWSELNYDRVNESLSRRGWPTTATKVLAEDPVLFASGGQGKFNARLDCLRTEGDAADKVSAKKKIQKEIDVLKKNQAELSAFDSELRHYADMKISLDLDDGVKVNYGKFGNLLAEKKVIAGKK